MKQTKLLGLAAVMLLTAGTASAQWTGTDIGTPTLVGSAVVNPDGTTLITGGGADIWGNSDQCYYYYKSQSGQFWSAVVRVQDLQGPDNWTKCELMVRRPSVASPPAADDQHISNMTTRSGGQNQVGPQYRGARAGGSGDNGGQKAESPTYPNTWLRVVRQGSVFSMSYSTDGVNWTSFFSQDTATTANGFDGTAWEDPINVGIAVTAHNDGNTTGAKALISDLTVTPLVLPTVVGISTQPVNAIAHLGGEASFHCAATNNYVPAGFWGMQYKWLRNGSPIANSQGPDLTFLTTAADNGAQFSCVATPAGLASPSVTSAAATLTLDNTVAFYTNGLKREFFRGGTRGSVESGSVPPATFIDVRSTLDDRGGYGDNYAQRVSGWFKAPVTDSYIFWVASDDDADVFLSTDSTPANKRIICQENGWSGALSWVDAGGGNPTDGAQKCSSTWLAPDFSNPWAAGLPLTAGNLYYIEAVMHQGGGGDNFAINYRTVTANTADPMTNGAPCIMTNNLQLISWPTTVIGFKVNPTNTTVYEGFGATLYAASTNDGEFLADYQWYKGAVGSGVLIAGATASSISFNPAGLTDSGSYYVVATSRQDGLTATSTAATLNVLQSVFEKGVVMNQVWQGVQNRVGAAAGTLGPASYQTTSPKFAASVNGESGGNYTRKLSGLFVPPTTGAYVFFVNSDDGSGAYISTDSNPAHKYGPIAEETGWSGSYNWVGIGGGSDVTKKRSDQWTDANGNTPYAAGINLTAGNKYYMEIDQAEGGGGDNVEMTYKLIADPDPVSGTDTIMKGNLIGTMAVRANWVAFTQQPTNVSAQPLGTATFHAAGISDSLLAIGSDSCAASNNRDITNVFVQIQWQKNGVDIAGATGGTLNYGPVQLADNNAQFVAKLRCLGYVTDMTTQTPLWSNSTPAILSLPADTTPPTLSYAGYYDDLIWVAKVVTVSFSEVMDLASLASATYTIPGVSVTSVLVNSNDYRSVRLVLSGAPTLPLNVTVTGAKDFSGNAAGTVSTAVHAVPLTNVDIGNVISNPDPAYPSYFWVDGANAYSVSAQGSDIWANADGFNFSYEMKTGDFDVVVRQKSIKHTSNWAKGGLMARETLAAGSRNWNIVNDPLASDGIAAPDGSGNGASLVECNVRDVTDAASNKGWDTYRPAPVYPNAWVRLKRVGNVMTAYNSTNGVSWNLQGTSDTTGLVGGPLTNAVLVGIVSTAHNNDPVPATGPLLYYNYMEFDSYNSSYVPSVTTTLTSTYNPTTGNVTVSWTPNIGKLFSSPTVDGTVWTLVGTGTANPAVIPATGSGMFFKIMP